MLGSALSAYVVLLGAVFAMQRSLLYQAAKQPPDLARIGVAGLAAVTTDTADGLTLTSLYRPPQGAGAPVIVVFHGNAGHAGDRVPKLVDYLHAGFGVMIAGYRGYGGNPGRPSEDDLTSDARVLLDWLDRNGVPAQRTVLYGESLGTGIAVKLAVERPVAAVVLESPYTSIAELAQLHYWFLPAAWMVLDKWRSMDHIEGLDAPLLVIHGARDRTIPLRYGRRLFEAAPEPKELLVLEHGGHNDLYAFPEVTGRVIQFLRRHVPHEG